MLASFYRNRLDSLANEGIPFCIFSGQHNIIGTQQTFDEWANKEKLSLQLSCQMYDDGDGKGEVFQSFIWTTTAAKRSVQESDLSDRSRQETLFGSSHFQTDWLQLVQAHDVRFNRHCNCCASKRFQKSSCHQQDSWSIFRNVLPISGSLSWFLDPYAHGSVPLSTNWPRCNHKCGPSDSQTFAL